MISLQLAMKAGVTIGDVKNVIIWGNHSSTQFPDVKHATVTKGMYFAQLNKQWHQ